MPKRSRDKDEVTQRAIEDLQTNLYEVDISSLIREVEKAGEDKKKFLQEACCAIIHIFEQDFYLEIDPENDLVSIIVENLFSIMTEEEFSPQEIEKFEGLFGWVYRNQMCDFSPLKILGKFKKQWSETDIRILESFMRSAPQSTESYLSEILEEAAGDQGVLKRLAKSARLVAAMYQGSVLEMLHQIINDDMDGEDLQFQVLRKAHIPQSDLEKEAVQQPEQMISRLFGDNTLRQTSMQDPNIVHALQKGIIQVCFPFIDNESVDQNCNLEAFEKWCTFQRNLAHLITHQFAPKLDMNNVDELQAAFSSCIDQLKGFMGQSGVEI